MTTTGATPVYGAAHNGHVEVLQVLISSGANIDTGTTNMARTPVWIAAQEGHTAALTLLIENHAFL